MKNLFLVILATLFVTIGAAQTHQHEMQATKSKSSESVKDTYTCPMHPEVKSDKPGKCPKCGMNLEKVTISQTNSVKEKVNKATALLKEAKQEAMQQGKYSCCVKEPCNTCLLEHQSCNCYNNLKNGKEVCNECYAGWQRGEGADKNIKPANVKTSYKKHNH
ncbi:MAG: hypothetical protein EPO24_04780 [Bacteroidetes bacterium]|nr:MAG: hypothetical protein EPO24_04780 [Bacteroidota bacterium]